MKDDDKHQEAHFFCDHCHWEGPGKELSVGDIYDAGYEIHCPKCGERLPGLVEFQRISNWRDSKSESSTLQ